MTRVPAGQIRDHRQGLVDLLGNPSEELRCLVDSGGGGPGLATPIRSTIHYRDGATPDSNLLGALCQAVREFHDEKWRSRKV